MLGSATTRGRIVSCDYPGADLASFARNAGFGDSSVSLDVRFLKHPEAGVYLELFAYH